MKELSKSIHRRLRHPGFTTRYFRGRVIDIGGAPDPLAIYSEFFPLVREIVTWDRDDGDAQFMAAVPDEAFDCVHSSHCLEHLEDPIEGLTNWFRILKPEGYLVVTVPDEDLYEQGVELFDFNKDHKWTFTVHKFESWSPRSLNVIDLLRALGPSAQVHEIRLEDSGYRYGLPVYDQTRTPVAESAIEFIVRKRTKTEIERGGRLPIQTLMDPLLKIHLDQYLLDQRAAARAFPDPFVRRSFGE